MTRLHADVVRTYIHGNVPWEIITPVTSYLVDGYYFSKKYKKGLWDGRAKFTEYDRKKKLYWFPTGMLERVTQALDEKGYFYELYDERPFPTAEPCYQLTGPDGNPIYLDKGKWDYQGRVLSQALAKGRGIIKVPTGGGKTEIGSGIIASINQPTIWFTDKLALLYQTQARLQERLQRPIGVIGDGQCYLQDINVCMVQTAQHRDKPYYENLNQFIRNHAQLVIGDEVHHLESDQWYSLFSDVQAPWRFGLSATPKLEGKGLALLAMTGNLIAEIEYLELFERRVLVPPRIWFEWMNSPQLPRDLKYQSAYKQGVTDCVPRHEKIMGVVQTLVRDNKFPITLVYRINHGNYLADFSNFKHIKAEFIQGATAKGVREDLMKKLANGDIQHLIANVKIMGEGVDIPHLKAIINATGLKGGADKGDEDPGRTTTQILGRALRSTQGKTYCDYVDIADLTHKSLISATQARLRTLELLGFSPFIKSWSEYYNE